MDTERLGGDRTMEERAQGGERDGVRDERGGHVAQLPYYSFVAVREKAWEWAGQPPQ